jgi:carbonic anhydrase
VQPLRAADPVNNQLLQQLRACSPPGQQLEALLEGNRRFAAAWQAASKLDDASQRMRVLAGIWQDNCQADPLALSQGQKPWVALLSCADSRVAAEWMFANGSGEMFQVSSAGNTAFDDAIASLEYAVSVLGVTLVLVMGHSGCGAVKAAMDNRPLTPLLENLVKPIRASLVPGDHLTKAIQGNARYAAAQLTARSAVLQQAVEAGKLSIRSAYFDISSGTVSLL